MARSLFVLLQMGLAYGCSNILVTPSASADGSAMIGDNDDSAGRHGLVTRFEAKDHAPGDMRAVWSFETGRLLGEIPQPRRTYNVIGHANEMGVVMGETTHGGLQVLDQNGKVRVRMAQQ